MEEDHHEERDQQQREPEHPQKRQMQEDREAVRVGLTRVAFCLDLTVMGLVPEKHVAAELPVGGKRVCHADDVRRKEEGERSDHLRQDRNDTRSREQHASEPTQAIDLDHSQRRIILDLRSDQPPLVDKVLLAVQPAQQKRTQNIAMRPSILIINSVYLRYLSFPFCTLLSAWGRGMVCRVSQTLVRRGMPRCRRVTCA